MTAAREWAYENTAMILAALELRDAELIAGVLAAAWKERATAGMHLISYALVIAATPADVLRATRSGTAVAPVIVDPNGSMGAEDLEIMRGVGEFFAAALIGDLDRQVAVMKVHCGELNDHTKGFMAAMVGVTGSMALDLRNMERAMNN